LEWDVAVVGASSAGLYAATQLARAGQRVAVFEQAQTLHPARRTLIVTPHLWRILPQLEAPVLLHTIRDLVLASAHAKTRVTLSDPDLIIERSALICWLEREARAAGVSLVLDRRFRAIRAQAEGAVLEFQNAAREKIQVTARTVLGADGVFSDVALAVGLKHPPSVPILQAEIELPRHWDPSVTQVWFDADETRFFYWLIPESETRAVVGLVGDERAQMRHILRRFLDREGFKALAYQGARIALYHPNMKPATRVGQARVLLIGDAAGQVKVTTVGGTVSGLLGADAATRALIENRAYERELRPLTRELELHWYMRVALDRFDNRAYEQLVQIVNPRVREFLSTHNRDEMASVAWRLPFLQPRLITLAPQILVRTLRGRALKTNVTSAAQDESYL
jgi:flavin-dependent dehydrogenase